MTDFEDGGLFDDYGADDLDYDDLVNPNSPHNNGCIAWWLSLPTWMGGRQWFDLFGLNHGTLTNMGSGGGWGGSGRPGGFGHLSFVNASSTYIDVPDNAAQRPTVCTIGCWLKTTQTTIGRMIFKSQNTALTNQAYSLNINVAAGKPEFRQDFAGGHFVTALTSVNDGNWHHIMGTSDGLSNGVIQIFVDGKFEASGTGFPLTYTNAVNLRFGGTGGGGTQYLDGLMDDVRLYNRVLSNREIFSLFTLSRLGYPGVLNRIEEPMSRTSSVQRMMAQNRIMGLNSRRMAA